MAKKFNRDGSFFAGDAQHTGQEPTWEDYDSLTQEEKDRRLKDALYFYSYYCDFEDLKKDFRTYATKYYSDKQVKYVLKWYKKASKSLFTSGKLARMVNRGLPENEANLKHFKNNFEEVLRACEICERYHRVDEAFYEKEKQKAKVVSPTKRLENKCNDKVISHLEGEVDAIALGADYEPLNISELLGTSNIPAKGCEYIMKSIHKELTFYEEVKEGKDEQLVEAYNFMGKRSVNKIIKVLKDWICDTEKYRQSIKR